MSQRSVTSRRHQPASSSTKKSTSQFSNKEDRHKSKAVQVPDTVGAKEILGRLERACVMVDGLTSDLYDALPNASFPIKIGRRSVGPRPETSTIRLILHSEKNLVSV